MWREERETRGEVVWVNRMPLHRHDSMTRKRSRTEEKEEDAKQKTDAKGKGKSNGQMHIGVVNPMPKQQFPLVASDPEMTMRILREELLLDGNAKQNLATFCQTYDAKWLTKLMELGQDKNLIDKDEYPQTAEIERRCVNLIADLWNAPAAITGNEAVGCSTVGSSEAAMLGGMAAKWRWRKARQAEGKPTDKPNMVCGSVQICWKKFAVYWDVEMREIEMRPGAMCMEPEDVIAQVDENTIFVVPTLGVTYHGLYEDVSAISDALDQVQRDKGWDIPIHVDGASGGFTVPFTAPNDVKPWDFRLPRVKSINASGHKFGLSPLGCGWCLWRTKEDLPDELIFHVTYLGGDMPTFQLNFSRPASQVIAQYFNFASLGKEGYKEVHDACHTISKYIASKLESLGCFDIIHDGDATKGIPCVTWTMKSDVPAGQFTLYDLADRLRVRGWQVPAYPFTGTYANTAYQRILVRRGFSRDLADLLMDDIEAAVNHFKLNPVNAALPPSERGMKAGYSHL